MQDFWERNYEAVERFVMRHVEDKEDAMDIVQEVFLVALTRKEKLVSHPNPTGWLINAAKYKISENVRSKRGTLSLEGLTYDVPDRQNYAELMEWLIFLKENASGEECGLLFRIGLEERSVREVAETTGIPASKLRKRVKLLQNKLFRTFYSDGG